MSAVKSYFRDSFSVTSIFIVIAIFSVTENSSRAEFDSGFLSSQQPLHRLSAVPLPLHGGGKHVRNLLLALSTWFLANQKYNWALVCLIFVRACHQRALLIRITYKHFIRGSEIWPFPLKTTFICKPPARVSAEHTTLHEHTKSAFSEVFLEKPRRGSAVHTTSHEHTK